MVFRTIPTTQKRRMFLRNNELKKMFASFDLGESHAIRVRTRSRYMKRTKRSMVAVWRMLSVMSSTLIPPAPLSRMKTPELIAPQTMAGVPLLPRPLQALIFLINLES